MRLLRAHILSTLTGPFLFSWGALTGMLMLNQLSRRFGDLVGKGLPAGVITEVLLLFIPFIVALTLPMAILVAVLYGFSQMGVDNEITAMRASGISVLQMLRPALVAGVLLSGFNFLFIDQVLPRTNYRLLNLQSDIGQKKPTFSLKEQAMNSLPGSQYYLRASTIEAGSGRMREVVIYDLSPLDSRRVIYADSGYMAFENGQKDLGLRLYDGRVHEYKTADPLTVNTTEFHTNIIRVRDIENAFRSNFGQSDRGDREMTTCEMKDRVGASRQASELAARHRQALGENDLRALLHLWGVPEPALPATPAKIRHCGAWRVFELWVGRLLLPKKLAAQGVVADTVPRAALPPTVIADTARHPISADSVAKPPTSYGAVFSTLSDVTIARENERFAIRDVDQFSVEIHKKYTLSVACLSFVLIGVALALRFPRGGIGLVIGGSLVIFALFYVALTAGEQLADRGIISAALAMWLPNVIVFVAGVIGLFRVNKEFGSTRGGDLGDLADLLVGWMRRRRRAG